MMTSTDERVGRDLPFSDVLRERAESKKSELASLLREKHRIAGLIENAKEYLTDLNALLRREGLPPAEVYDTSTATGFGVPGNRSEKMPMRKPEWQKMSLSESIHTILDIEMRVWHADELVLRIFDSPTDEEARHAKHSLVSTLRAGVKEGKWAALPRNIYHSLQMQVAEVAPAQSNLANEHGPEDSPR